MQPVSDFWGYFYGVSADTRIFLLQASFSGTIVNIFPLHGNPQGICRARRECSICMSHEDDVPWGWRFEVYILPHMSTATIGSPHLCVKTTFRSEEGGVERLPSSRGSLYWETS